MVRWLRSLANVKFPGAPPLLSAIQKVLIGGLAAAAFMIARAIS